MSKYNTLTEIKECRHCHKEFSSRNKNVFYCCLDCRKRHAKEKGNAGKKYRYNFQTALAPEFAPNADRALLAARRSKQWPDLLINIKRLVEHAQEVGFLGPAGDRQ